MKRFARVRHCIFILLAHSFLCLLSSALVLWFMQLFIKHMSSLKHKMCVLLICMLFSHLLHISFLNLDSTENFDGMQQQQS